MKHKVLATLFVFALMSCDIKIETRGVKADPIFSSGNFTHINQKKHYVDDMEFVIFYSSHAGSQPGNGVAVVNITKEKLEIEKLKLEIEVLKNNKNGISK